MLEVLVRLNTNYIRSWHILWNKNSEPPGLQISRIEQITQTFCWLWKSWTIVFALQFNNFWEWLHCWIRTASSISSSKSKHWIFQTCGVDQRSLMYSIIPVWNFHNPKQKIEGVQTHSVSLYPCLILTYWRLILKVRNLICCVLPDVQIMY